MKQPMRPNLLSVPQNESRSFDLRHEIVPYFNNPWHFHPEIELNFIISGSGTRFIGQSVERFRDGEIVLLGKNLPHYWKNDNNYYNPASNRPSEAIIARFSEDFAGKDFFRLPETQLIHTLLERSAFGLQLLDPVRTQIQKDLYQLLKMEGFEQLMALLAILQKIALSGAFEEISPNYIPSQLIKKSNERLNKVIAHVLEFFTGDISLKEVADLANMSEAAFCRYFKAQTGKTLTGFITDLRIQYACNLLSNTDESVSQVCFQIGFENVSHFIQTFKKLRNQTPFEFRQNTRKLK
ncbi:AraC family transcriptional regulator [Dyadobacter bucti]|uniref:AraC family transcriptional regulator n=1 Tax=Dyadobacter bucti TaxID=2572203 RepID=UPI001109EBB3|nr:helix-turn-helix domain-containing protein [Dyadobacter bucti]